MRLIYIGCFHSINAGRARGLLSGLEMIIMPTDTGNLNGSNNANHSGPVLSNSADGNRRYGSIDDLTGLFDRSCLAGLLPADIRRCRQQSRPLAIIVADIDFFRVINENCSPTAGDMVLRHFGRMLNSGVQSAGGWAARYGGEEFLACLPEFTRSEAAQTAERLRRALEDSTVLYREIEIKLTASFGVAALPDTANQPVQLEEEEATAAAARLLEEAEARLSEAKAGGRNQVRA